MKINDDFPSWIKTLTESEKESLEHKDRRSDQITVKKQTEETNEPAV